MMRSVKKFLNALKFTYFSLFTITLSAIILFTFMLDIVQKETYELKEFQIAHEAIRSLKTVEDTVKTEQERDRAANEVAPVYQFTEDVAKNRQAIATSIFDFLLDVKKELVADSAEEVEEVKIAEKSVEAMREKLAALEAEEPELQLSNKAIADLLAQDIETLEGIKTSVVSVLGEELSKPLRTSDLTFAKYEVERQLRLSNTIPVEIEEPVISIARSLLVETEIFNETLTASRVQEAREAVEPIRILQGQVIVREGQVIDREVYRQLELAGLLTNQTQVKPLAGIALFVSVMMSIFFLHFQTWRESSIVKKKSLVIALVVFFISDSFSVHADKTIG